MNIRQNIRIDEKDYSVTINEIENNDKMKLFLRVVLSLSFLVLLFIFIDIFSEFASFSLEVKSKFLGSKINLYFYFLLGLYILYQLYEIKKVFNQENKQSFFIKYDYFIKLMTFGFFLLSIFFVQQNILLDSIKTNLEVKEKYKQLDINKINWKSIIKLNENLKKEISIIKEYNKKLNIKLDKLEEKIIVLEKK